MDPFDDEVLKFGASKAVQARPAREGDDAADVLTLGVEFSYLVADPDGQLMKASEGPHGWPSRVVFDADSFLDGLAPREPAMLAVRESDGLMFKIGLNSAEGQA